VPTAFQSTNPIFHDEHTARMALEALRWPDGPVCPKINCGAGGLNVAKIGGVKQSHREGLYRCKTCRGQFTVTVGTIFERSRVPLRDWLRAIHMFNSNKHKPLVMVGDWLRANQRGPLVTIREVQVELDVTYKTALEIWKRICAALRAYRGHNKGFGRKVTALISSTRPKRKWQGVRAYWIAKNKRLLKDEGPAPKATGILWSAEAPTENLESTERLLRVLIAATPKFSKSAKKKAAKLIRLERGVVSAEA
jgi:hypothetical protein